MLPIVGVVYLLLALAVVLQGRRGGRRELLYGALLAAVLVTVAWLWERTAGPLDWRS
jgi:hypothetical protein